VKVYLQEGDNLLVAASGQNSSTFTAVGRIERLEPFIVRILTPPNNGVPKFTNGFPLVLLAQRKSVNYRADASVTECSPKHDGMYLELNVPRWQKLERRRSPRVRTAMPIIIVSTEELESASRFTKSSGMIVDIGITGARFLTEIQLGLNWLVHVEGTLPNQRPFRALAEVVRLGDIKCENKYEYALNFVELLGDTKDALKLFLRAEAREGA
jgi:hypothetical protein